MNHSYFGPQHRALGLVFLSPPWIASILWMGILAFVPGRAQAQYLDTLYDRIAVSTREGQPLEVEVFIALCDNDSQGIVPVKNPRICQGDDAKRNLYWGISGGLGKLLQQSRFKKTLHKDKPKRGILFDEVWQARYAAGGTLRHKSDKKWIKVKLIAHVYRGVAIEQAMRDYLSAHAAQNAAHVVGYIGHNYLLDKALTKKKSESQPVARGTFALSCLGEGVIRPYIERAHTQILALNRSLTYPGAWTLLGLIEGLTAGRDAKGVHFQATKRFAEGRKKKHSVMLRAFSYGPAKRKQTKTRRDR